MSEWKFDRGRELEKEYEGSELKEKFEEEDLSYFDCSNCDWVGRGAPLNDDTNDVLDDEPICECPECANGLER